MDMNIMITVLSIIHCAGFYLEHAVSETGFCLHERWIMYRIAIVILI
jgi:hypothetical protein